MLLRLNILLLIVTIVSAMALVQSQYESRKLFTELDQTLAQARQLETDQQRLQVEKRAQATPLRLEQLARDKIGGPSLRRFREIADAWRQSASDARRGEFGHAHEHLDRAERLAAGAGAITVQNAVASARCDLEARQKASAEGAEGHKADPELLKYRKDLFFRFAPPEGVFALQRRHRLLRVGLTDVGNPSLR